MGMLDYVVHRLPATQERVRQEIIAGVIPHWVKQSKRARYISQVIISKPEWVCREELKRIQTRARQISELSGVDHHICHGVPLCHPRVCGLTVPWNLEIKPAVVNLAESNHVHIDWDEQLPLF